MNKPTVNLTICTRGNMTYLTAWLETEGTGDQEAIESRELWQQELPGRLTPADITWTDLERER